MTEFAAIEINSVGIVNYISIPSSIFWKDILPAKGENLLYHWKESVNEQIKEFVEEIFNSSNQIKRPISINSHTFNCTAFRSSSDKATICWEIDYRATHQSIENVKNIRMGLVNFAFENSNTAIHFVNKDGSFYDFNNALNSMLGYTREEFFKLTIFDINPTINEEYWQKVWKDLKENGARTVLAKQMKKDGSLIDIELKSILINYDGFELNCAFINDITERKKLEESLKLVDFAFRNTSIPMHFLKEDGQVFDCNHAACNLLGYTREEYLSLPVFQLNENITIDFYNRDWETLTETSNRVLNFKITKKNKELIDCEIRSNKIKYGNQELMCSSFIDITEKKKTEQRLKIIDFAFRNSSIPMHFLRKDGSVYDFNANSSKLLGYTDEEFSKLNLVDFSTRHNPQSWQERWEVFKKANKLSSITKLKRKDNSHVDVEVITDIVEYGDEELTFSSVINLTEKKKTEQKLKIVEHAFRHSSTPSVFFRKDGSIFDFNEIACQLFGYTAKEFKNISIFDMSLRHNEETWEKRWDELTSNIHTSFITNIRKKDYSIIDVEIRSDLFQYENEELNFSSFIDITQKKKAELDLKRSNERYENALIATSDVIWEVDLITDMNYYSKNFTHIFGHSTTGVEYGNDNVWRRNLHPDDKQRVIEGEANVEKGLTDHWEVEYRLKKADGNYALVLDRGFSVRDEETGKVLRLVGAMQDITKKKAEESRLKLLESVVVHTNDAIVITEAEPIEAPGPIIIYVNDAYTKMTGYSLEESIGTSPRKLQNNHTERKELDKIKSALKNWKSAEMTVRNVKKNGEEFWANIRVTPIANEKGIFTHWVSIQRDVTKEIIAQTEKEYLLNELINNNKELKQFGYITTHNLRSPLTNLMSICKLVDESKIEDANTLKLIRIFKESTFVLNETLNDLINILIIKARVDISINELQFVDSLNKVKGMISESIETNMVIIETDFTLAQSVRFSPIYLDSLFLNLLTNSIKYAYPSRNPIIKISSQLLPDDRVKLIFSDNGLGMDMEQVKGKIFGFHQRFHDNTDSKGLGLYLIQSQINALGGTIEVDSKENEGTTFIITFKNQEY